MVQGYFSARFFSGSSFEIISSFLTLAEYKSYGETLAMILTAKFPFLHPFSGYSTALGFAI